jgi:hypothetical protein
MLQFAALPPMLSDRRPGTRHSYDWYVSPTIPYMVYAPSSYMFHIYHLSRSLIDLSYASYLQLSLLTADTAIMMDMIHVTPSLV